MSIMSDRWIRERALGVGMIEPFVDGQKREGTISYGLSLLIHTVTVVVSWRQLFDPWGLAKVGNHLWISTWPTWGGFAALFLMRDRDIWTVDGWRRSRGALPTKQATGL